MAEGDQRQGSMVADIRRPSCHPGYTIDSPVPGITGRSARYSQTTMSYTGSGDRSGLFRGLGTLPAGNPRFHLHYMTGALGGRKGTPWAVKTVCGAGLF